MLLPLLPCQAKGCVSFPLKWVQKWLQWVYNLCSESRSAFCKPKDFKKVFTTGVLAEPITGQLMRSCYWNQIQIFAEIDFCSVPDGGNTAPAAPASYVMPSFEAMDTNRDGVISRAEYQNATGPDINHAVFLGRPDISLAR